MSWTEIVSRLLRIQLRQARDCEILLLEAPELDWIQHVVLIISPAVVGFVLRLLSVLRSTVLS
jgi:hypothetical protein